MGHPFPLAELLGDVRSELDHLRDDQALVHNATRYVLNHLALDLSCQELASLLGSSEKRLTQVLFENLGLTLAEYMLQERMRMAQRLLLQTSLGLVVIAQQVGFDNGSCFSKTFREHVGVTPWVFRDKPPSDALTLVQGTVQWG
jgi:transcriptional regulator GlxA family with amidase domain